MRIAGVQKLTLLDYPGQIACTVFLPGCNLRCPFCHNPSLVLPHRFEDPLTDEDGLLEFLRSRQGKLDGVCVTGGEPTLHPELAQLLRRIKALGFLVKLDTNGTQPGVLRSLLQDGLVDYIAMDVKNSPAHYWETCGETDVLPAVAQSVALLLEGHVDYEFRTTVVHPLHTLDDFDAIGRWLAGAKRYYLQQFVDSGDLIGTNLSPMDSPQMEAFRQCLLPYIPNTQLRGI